MGCCGRRIRAAATPPPAEKQVEAEAVSVNKEPRVKHPALTRNERRLSKVKEK